MTLTQWLQAFLALGLGSAFITPLINLLKVFKVVTDGNAEAWDIGLNLGLFVLFVIGNLVVLPAGLSVAGVVAILTTLGSIIVLLLPLIGQIVVSKLVHALLKRIPALRTSIGFSFSRGK